MRLLNNPNSTAGKMTVSILIAGFAVFLVLFSFDFQHEYVVQKVQAQTNDTATTTVNVLNTAPLWTLNAQEEGVGSATSTPTNATTTVEFVAIGTDSNAEDYFLIICSVGAAPTAVEDAPPTCSGGAGNTWAVSPTTTSGTVATATYTTLTTDDERNAWWASICDANSGFARCNTEIQQGDIANDTATSSPFHVNHRPDFTIASNTSPVDPGAVFSFTSTSSDADVLGSDTVRIIVCRTAGFDYVTNECDGGDSDTWATSTLFAADAATSTVMDLPKEDGTFSAFFYAVDNHGFAALAPPDEALSAMGTNTPLIVNNVAPTVGTSTMFLNYGNDITLITPGGISPGYTATFKVTDNNSCRANGDTTDEFNSAVIGIFRSGETTVGCDEGTDFDTNHCYHTATGTAFWATTLVATTTDTCDDSDDLTRDYEFTFPLWFNADPTNGAGPSDSPWWDEDWVLSVIVDDDNFATSTVATSSGVELLPLSAFEVTELDIPYGSIEPGGTTTPVLGAPNGTTTIVALGNIGIDQALSGTDMCDYFTVPGSCWTHSSTSTIPVEEQRFGTSTITYDQATALSYILSSTTPYELEVNVKKTTSTSSPESAPITWGIQVPNTITLSGSYSGQNTFTIVAGEATDW